MVYARRGRGKVCLAISFNKHRRKREEESRAAGKGYVKAFTNVIM